VVKSTPTLGAQKWEYLQGREVFLIAEGSMRLKRRKREVRPDNKSVEKNIVLVGVRTAFPGIASRSEVGVISNKVVAIGGGDRRAGFRGKYSQGGMHEVEEGFSLKGHREVFKE